jgi:oligopeptide/dipeptide ABC transporter ATP-binding protein
MTQLVAAEGLTKTFGDRPRQVRAVDDVSLRIAPGEVLGVVGESGSGKSTLGRLLLRLIEPSSGTTRFEKQDLAALGPRALRRFRRNMQMIFQDPFASLNPRMTIGDALADPLRLHFGLRGSALQDASVALLQQVGLTAEHLRRYPRAFSGGQRQRVAIARALASRPRFIVADEPVSALDVSIQAEVVNLLQALQTSLGLALLFISHDLSVVEVIADRVMVMYLGRVMEAAPTEALFAQPRHPYTAALMQAAPGARPAGQRLLLSGEIPSPLDPPSGCVFRTRCPFAIADCAAVRPGLREVGPDHVTACIRDGLPLS